MNAAMTVPRRHCGRAFCAVPMTVMTALAWVCVALAMSGCSLLPDREANEKRQQGADAYVQLGIDALRRNELAEANFKLDKALKMDPKSAHAHWAYAVLQERVRRYDLAREHFLRAIKLDPKDTTALHNFGNFLCRQRQIAEAIEIYTQAAADLYNPNPEESYYNAGLCLVNAGQTEQAKDYLRDALVRNPHFAQALYLMAAVSYTEAEYLNTRAFLQRYAERYPQIPETLKLCILTEQVLDDLDAAEGCRNQLLTEFPDTPIANEFKSSPP